MNLVDSSGWLEYFANGKNADVFAPIIEKTDKLIVSTVNLYEVYKKVLAVRGEYDALKAVGLMQQATVIPLSAPIALHAATLSASRIMPMADSMIYATALAHNAVVWTQDADFKDLEKVKYIKAR